MVACNMKFFANVITMTFQDTMTAQGNIIVMDKRVLDMLRLM